MDGNHSLSLTPPCATFATVVSVSEACGVTLQAARLALKANNGNVDDAVEQLVYGYEFQCTEDVYKTCVDVDTGHTFTDAAAVVAETCSVSLLVAEAKLKAHSDDVEAAIDDIIYSDDVNSSNLAGAPRSSSGRRSSSCGSRASKVPFALLPCYSVSLRNLLLAMLKRMMAPIEDVDLTQIYWRRLE